MNDSLSWACWREPDSEQLVSLFGSLTPVLDGQLTQGGFFIHPFEGSTGYLIKGAPVPFVLEEMELLPAYPGPAFQVVSKVAYVETISHLIADMGHANLQKVVLSRRIQMDMASWNTQTVLEGFLALEKAYPQCFVALVSLPNYGTWLCATPEVLCSKSNIKVSTMALAGTRTSPSTDAWTEKEYEEQQIVADYIRQKLIAQGSLDIEENGPYASASGSLWHLRTDFTAQGIIPLTAIGSGLHPTPAVCGFPVEAAKTLIEKYEASPRSLYTGYLGYLPENEAETATLYVHLRCACFTQEGPVLFAGGGIMPSSDPEDEWRETESKVQVLWPLLASLKAHETPILATVVNS